MTEMTPEFRKSLKQKEDSILRFTHLSKETERKIPLPLSRDEQIRIVALMNIYNPDHEPTDEVIQKVMNYIDETISSYTLVAGLINGSLVINPYDNPEDFLFTATNRGEEEIQVAIQEITKLTQELKKNQDEVVAQVANRLEEITKQINNEFKITSNDNDFGEDPEETIH